MKKPKKNSYKELEIRKNPDARKGRIAFAIQILKGDVAYDETYDSYYETATGKWLERKCGDKNCQFCSKRPKKKKL